VSEANGHGDRELTLGARTWLRLGVRRREPVEAARLARPVGEARVAVVSTGGATLPGQEPFDTGKAGDASFREIPSGTDPSELRFHHPHYDTDLARRDPDCVFPLRLLGTLAEEGAVGEVAPTAVSMMGYVPLTRELTGETAPRIGELMQGEAVDAALLCPA
jgi:D-proline reductase (dithiol) PrdB